MRILAGLIAATACLGAASAQPTATTAWNIPELHIGLTLPAGWTVDTPSSPGLYGATKASQRAGSPAEAFCLVSDLATGAPDPGEKPMTQDDINRGNAPLPLDLWITLMSGLGIDHLTWLESRPTIIVDGKAAVSARGATDGKPIRRIVHMAQVMTPERLYPVVCLYYTGLPPFQESAEFRARALAEFETLLRTFHTVSN